MHFSPSSLDESNFHAKIKELKKSKNHLENKTMSPLLFTDLILIFFATISDHNFIKEKMISRREASFTNRCGGIFLTANCELCDV